MVDKKNQVIIEDYNPEWAVKFDMIKQFLWLSPVLCNYRVEHVGSTAVAGLAAKPIIDIDIVVSEEDKQKAHDAICAIGYTHLGDLGIIGREAYRLQGKEEFMRHNLYLCLEGSLAIKNHLSWRDYLRSSEDVRNEYAKLKKELALRFPDDVDKYCAAKTAFITHGLSRFLPESDINMIKEQNL